MEVTVSKTYEKLQQQQAEQIMEACRCLNLRCQLSGQPHEPEANDEGFKLKLYTFTVWVFMTGAREE